MPGTVSQNGKSMSVLVKHGFMPQKNNTEAAATRNGPTSTPCAQPCTAASPEKSHQKHWTVFTKTNLNQSPLFGVNCPKCIEQAITKGLSVRKDGRYQSMEELYDALYKGKPPKPKNNKTKLIIAAVATAAVGIAVIAGVGIK